jgi:hypothetical protein
MRRRAHLGSAALEQLLNSDARDSTQLAQLLAAACAAGTPEELAGLDATRTAFLADRQAPGHSVGRLPAVTRTTAGRLFALKALAAVSGATLIGGVAYATASNTGLLGGSHHHTQPSTSAPATTDSTAQLPGGGLTEGSSGLPESTHPHPSRATTPHRGRGPSVRVSARPGHVPPLSIPHSGAPTTAPAPPTTSDIAPPTNSNPAPSTTAAGHAKTTPPHVPTSPGGTHRPTSTRSGRP